MSVAGAKLIVSAIGVPIGVEFVGEVAGQAADAARRAWAGLAVARDEEDRAASELRLVVNQADEIESALDDLSTRVTLAAIEHQAGSLVMLHAAGLAHPQTRRVVACVAPSGTGKTTLAAAAAGTLEYVTDETVAVDDGLRVVPYPKPLSMRHPYPTPGKTQHHPSEIGIQVADRNDLVLGSIVLLDRVSDGAPGRLTPRLSPIAILEAVVELVPELSYLSRMERPIHRIVSLIEAAGGVARLTYRDARQAIPFIMDLAAKTAVDAPQSSALLKESDAEIAWWVGALTSAREGGVLSPKEFDSTHSAAAQEPPQLSLSHELADLVVDVERQQGIAFVGNQVSLVSLVGAAILLAAHHNLPSTRLDYVLSRIFGSPPTSDATFAAIRTLTEAGLLLDADMSQ